MSGDAILCRTCMRPITFETRTEPDHLPREGWYDDCRVDQLICFKAADYRHVPLTDRERAYYDAGRKAGAAEVKARVEAASALLDTLYADLGKDEPHHFSIGLMILRIKQIRAALGDPS